MITLSKAGLDFVLDVLGMSHDAAEDEEIVLERIKLIQLDELKDIARLFELRWTDDGRGACKKGYVGLCRMGHPIPLNSLARCITGNVKIHYQSK